jgi:N-methylhydantoinase B
MTHDATSFPAEGPAIDPITFEVIRHKLQAITEEQAITLKSISGSPVVTEATDFNNGLYLTDGSIVTMGPQVIFHTGTMCSVIRNIIQDFSENPGIREGDMFILNDPYRGAIHQPDVSIVAPIFHDGRRIAWAGSCAHQLDTGGMSFGSWAYAATEVQQEAMLLSGVKLVEGGEIRADLWKMIMGMTRLPHVLGLDLKGMIAANNVAIRRVTELIHRYSVETVEAVMHAEIEASERRMRERLRKIPDGVYRARDYIDHDGHANRLYRVCLAVHKTGDELVFDMEGTSPQAPGFINCTFSGMKGALLTGLLPILAPDIRWNEGVLRPVSIRAEEGILCNASWPAPVSGATISTVWIVMNVAVAALSRMVSCLPAMAREGQSVTKGQMSVLTLAGRDRDGGPYGTFLLDSMAGGGGAFVDHDGLNGSGDYDVPRPSIANVEANEGAGPLLYLFRGFVPDTGGPGRTRGGLSTGLAIAPHDVDSLDAMLVSHGVEVPNSVGLFGGLPGGCAENRLGRLGGDAATAAGLNRFDAPASAFDDALLQSVGAKPGSFKIRKDEVFAYLFQGGGGYGDPLQRDPDLVALDVEEGFVTASAAAEYYGVALSAQGGSVDAKATAEKRHAALRARLDGQEPVAQAKPAASCRANLTADNGRFRCCCGADLGPANENWKTRCAMKTVPPRDIGRYIVLHEELELRSFYCRSCATQLEVEVCRKDEDSLSTMTLCVA